ncbi:MAG: ATP-binding protein [Planctomycetes bacterium]|nr:ATP-binding protein [Planctomycetota bacterium]
MKLLDFWPSPEAVARCIPSEAEVISEAAFLAVHQPVQLVRRSLTQSDAPQDPADERAVLKALLTPHLPEGYVIVPIVGPSGVGKSHLIRWLGLHLPRPLHVISIPKSTSLRRILESILKGLDGPGYDEIRKQLLTAHEQLDVIAAEELLLAHFRTALRRRTNEAQAACEAARRRNENPPQDQRLVAETHGEGLIALLEGQTKDVLLQDTAKRRSVLRALVQRVVTGRIEAENGQFAASDFEFASVNPAKLSDQKSQRYVTKLKANSLNDREKAADVMNEVRDWAVGQLLGLGENQLADLFRRVREELFKDGRELVLLIEDFTTLAGVQHGLLDVIKMEGVRAGEAERCTLRTALAVTEGYLSPYDTLKTRAGYEFVIREQPAGEVELLETITNMVGAYLNAARIGPERLAKWFEETNRDPDAPPPSFEAAAGGLSNADRAAVEAFGRSQRKHSLFPFNRSAIKHLASQHLAASDSVRVGSPKQLRLNPRKLIKDVLHATLLPDRDAFIRGAFPPEAFHSFNPNDLGIDVMAWLATRTRTDHRKYAVLLGYWGDRPRHPDAVKLPAPVYEAFGMVPLSAASGESELRPLQPEPKPAQDPGQQDEIARAVDARERVLEDWATKKRITQRDATALRGDLLDMLEVAIDWDAELMAGARRLTSNLGNAVPAGESGDTSNGEEFDAADSLPAEGNYPRELLRTAVGPQWVYLPFSPTATGATPDDAIFTLCRDEVLDDPLVFAAIRFELRALVRFHVHKTFDYPGGDEDRAWYARLSERAARQATAFLRKRYERVPDNDVAIDAVAQALYVSARVLDIEGAHSNQDAEVLKAVLHPGPGSLPHAQQSGVWQLFRQACAGGGRAAARDFLLRRVAARQGAGRVLYGIDGARLLAALGPTRKSCRVTVTFPGDRANLDDNARQVFGFVAELSPSRTRSAVEDRRAALLKWSSDTLTWLGVPFDKRGLVQECVELLTQAKNLRVFWADVEYDTLRRFAREFEDAAVSDAIAAVQRLEGEAAAGVVLTAVVQAPDDAMRKADTFRTAFEAFQCLTLPKAREEIGKKLRLAGAAPDAAPEALMPTEARALDNDLQSIAFAVGSMGGPVTVQAPAAVATDAAAPTAAAPARFFILRSALDHLSRVDAEVQELKQLEPVRREVNGWATELPGLVRQYALFDARPDVMMEEAPDGGQVANAVAAARSKVAESPLEIMRNRTFANLKSAVTKLIESYRGAIAAAWRAWAEKLTPRVDDAELAPFEQHPEYRQAVIDIRAKRASMKRVQDIGIVTDDGFVRFESLAADLRELLGRLPTEAPEGVKRFLAATNTRDGATLDMLNEAVVQWLHANKQFDKYRIRR